MSAILDIERKSPRTRIFLAIVYGVLTMGAATMVYPFAVMIAGSLSSSYDYERHSPVVAGFFDDDDRFVRSLATHFDHFPHDVYPDAPKEWTSWAEVANDRANAGAFARRELAPYTTLNDDPNCPCTTLNDANTKRPYTTLNDANTKRPYTTLNDAREAAQAFLRSLLDADPRTLYCKYDPRDIPGFCKKRYGTVDAMNAAWTVPHKSFFDVSFRAESRLGPDSSPDDPEKYAAYLSLVRSYILDAIEAGDYVSRTLPRDFAANAAEIRNALAVQFIDHGKRDFWRDAFANYATVGEYLFVRGRAFANTLILVIISVLASLTVNPLAAYALSRFKMRSTEKILLFLLATMAFPAAVTAIPGFLLLRDLGLLNTFAALVLPSVASGMSIFILKGFFDALPSEIYEAAAIDGASEWTVFRRITLPMTTPILAVNALNAFIHAYASWEWAFLVCHKESHWTLAVWMYQMASETFIGQPWCIMAGFVLVSIPTAVVFLLCQKVILRGIVLPSMK